MKIKVLRIKDFKKIKELEIRPEDNVIVIAGENASGKTSALDAIAWCLGGEGLGKKKITEPVRKGQKKAEVVMEIGNFVVRKYCKDNRIYKLTVTSDDETMIRKSPQNLLDSFVGTLSFDPREFMMFNPKKQRDLLLEAFGLKDKLDEIDRKREQIYDERTDVNKDIKTYEGQLKGLKKPEKDLPIFIISISELYLKLKDAEDWNNKINVMKKQIKDYELEIEVAKKSIKYIKEDLKDKNPINTDSIKEELSKAEGINEKIKEAEKYDEISDLVNDRKSESEKQTKEIAELDNSKLKFLKEKKIPFKNLTIEKEGIKLQDIPFNQLADSERLKISIEIAMILNPKLRVIRITDANLFDDRNMQIIEEMADKFEYQMWIERIAVDKFADIVLVDGEIERNKK